MGHWVLGIGHWAWGMGHGALGIGHWALGIRQFNFGLDFNLKSVLESSDACGKQQSVYGGNLRTLRDLATDFPQNLKSKILFPAPLSPLSPPAPLPLCPLHPAPCPLPPF
jgi:hypothetical protein